MISERTANSPLSSRITSYNVCYTKLLRIENGYEFSFSPAMSYRGVTNGDKKYLVLNPTEKDDRLVVTLAHELRHAQQFSNGIVKDVKANNIRTEVLKTRAIEADAFAYSILVAHELKTRITSYNVCYTKLLRHFLNVS